MGVSPTYEGQLPNVQQYTSYSLIGQHPYTICHWQSLRLMSVRSCYMYLTIAADNQLPTMATFKGGYNYEFVNPPPNYLECSICLLTLRDPHVISCCGNHFCHTCIGRIQGDPKPCPLCNEPNFTTLLHKGVKREVNALMIRCRRRHLGCDWEGELGQLEEHLHPGVGSRGKGCGYVIVECVYKCGDRFERRTLQDHELDVCPRRPMEVQMSSLARKFEASLRANEKKLNDVIAENEAIKDENRATRANVEALHFKNDAILAENQSTKAEVKAIKDENDAVRAENLSTKAENKILTKRIAQLERKVRLVEEKHDNLERELDTRIVPAPVPPFYFRIFNYDHYRKVDYRWLSPSFYSHPGGYKLFFQVYTNGENDGKGTHLSLFVAIMRGEYDDKLKWPFNGVVTIEMFNWQANKWDYSKTITLNDSVPINCRSRAVDSFSCVSRWGYSMWIPLAELSEKYQKGGIVRFKVTKVELK